jgi:hypothetical protein
VRDHQGPPKRYVVEARDHGDPVDPVPRGIAYLAIGRLVRLRDLGSIGFQGPGSGVGQRPLADQEDADRLEPPLSALAASPKAVQPPSELPATWA